MDLIKEIEGDSDFTFALNGNFIHIVGADDFDKENPEYGVAVNPDPRENDLFKECREVTNGIDGVVNRNQLHLFLDILTEIKCRGIKLDSTVGQVPNHPDVYFGVAYINRDSIEDGIFFYYRDNSNAEVLEHTIHLDPEMLKDKELITAVENVLARSYHSFEDMRAELDHTFKDLCEDDIVEGSFAIEDIDVVVELLLVALKLKYVKKVSKVDTKTDLEKITEMLNLFILGRFDTLCLEAGAVFVESELCPYIVEVPLDIRVQTYFTSRHVQRETNKEMAMAYLEKIKKYLEKQDGGKLVPTNGIPPKHIILSEVIRLAPDLPVSEVTRITGFLETCESLEKAQSVSVTRIQGNFTLTVYTADGEHFHKRVQTV